MARAQIDVMFATLHEAMVEVLRTHGDGWMARGEIAQQIAERDLWRRPSDGLPPPSGQIRLRARKYGHLFECGDPGCGRIRLRQRELERALQPATRARGRPAPAAISSSPSTESGSAWYERLRARNRPERLRVLLIGESPPDPGSGARRFFYSPELTADNLYRGVAEAVYGLEPDFDVRAKPDVLERLRADGFWLIDAVSYPVNKLSSARRRQAVAAGVPALVDRCTELAPERGVVICHTLVYKTTGSALRESGIPVLHDEPLPFPLGNWRAQFVAGMRAGLETS